MKRWIGILLGMLLVLLPACGASEQTGKEEMDEGIAAPGEDKKAADLMPDETDGQAWNESGEKPEDIAADENVLNAGTEEPGDGDSDEKIRYAGKGMKLSILGDSISTFEGWIPEGNADFYPQNGAVKDVSQTWWKIVLDEAGLTLCTNGSSSGSACFGYSQEEEPAYGCSDYRIAQLAGAGGEVPDIIIVYMGTNDVLMSASLGDNDGLREVAEGLVGSLSDGYTMILDKLERQYPMAQIYCCTLLPIGDWGTEQPFVDFVNGQGLTSKEYADQIQIIARNRGIPVIDLYHCGITIDNMSEMTSDGVHLTPEGMRCVADMVLKSIVTGNDIEVESP